MMGGFECGCFYGFKLVDSYKCECKLIIWKNIFMK